MVDARKRGSQKGTRTGKRKDEKSECTCQTNGCSSPSIDWPFSDQDSCWNSKLFFVLTNKHIVTSAEEKMEGLVSTLFSKSKTSERLLNN